MKIAQKHPITEIQHPWAGVRGQLGLSQEALAEKCSVTPGTVQRVEKGLFREPPYSVLNCLSKELYRKNQSDTGTTEALQTSYYDFQKRKRLRFKEKYSSPDEIDLIGIQHPLVIYRNHLVLSQIGFCSELCVHPYPVAEWEKRKRREIPVQIKEAFEEAGIDVEPLVNAVEEWRRLY